MLSSLTSNSVYKLIVKILVFFLIIGLPLTSFPIFSKLTGAIVAPFSAIPLVLLFLVWMVPYIIGRGKLPGEVMPILYFTLVTLAISAGAFPKKAN